MAHFFQIVNNVDEIKRICSNLNLENLNLENIQVVSMGGVEDGHNSQQLIITQDDSLVLNDAQVPQIVYQQQQSQQSQNQTQQTPTHYIIQQDEDSDTSISQQQIFYSTDLEGDQLVQQHQLVQQSQSQVMLRHIPTPSQQQAQQQQQQQQSILVQKPAESDLRQTVPTQVLMQPTSQSTTPQHVILQQSTPHVVLQQQHQATAVQQQNVQPQQPNQAQQQQQQQIVMRHQIPTANMGQPRIIYTQPRTVVFTHQISQQQLQQHQLQQQSTQQQQSEQQSQSSQQESVKPSPQPRAIQHRQASVQTTMPNIIFTPVQQHQQQEQQVRTQVTPQTTPQAPQDTLQQTNQQIQHSTYLATPRVSQIVRNPSVGRGQVNPTPRLQIQSRPNIRLNLIQNSSAQSPNNTTASVVTQTRPLTQNKPAAKGRATVSTRGRGGRGRGRGASTACPKSTSLVTTPQASVSRQVDSTSLPQQSTTSQQTTPQQQQQPQTSVSSQNMQKIYQTQTLNNSALQQHRLLANQVQQRLLGQQFQKSVASSTLPLATTTAVQTPQPKFRSPPPLSKTVGTSFQGAMDLEDSIQAVVVSKSTDTATTVANTSVSETKTLDNTTLTTYSLERLDDDKKSIRLTNGRVMSLLDYKRLRQPQPVRTLASARTTNSTIPVNRVTPMPISNPVTSKTQTPSQNTSLTVSDENRTVRTQTQNTVQPQHVIQAQNRNQLQIQEGDTQKSARMLVVLSTGEQRLITFTLPKESCTVQELLEQVGVPFTPETSIQCVPNPGANIDYVVTVGLNAQESTSELISAAEQSLQQQKTVEPQLQQAQALETSPDTTQITQSPQTITLHVERPSNSTEVRDVPAKFIQGFLAVCQICGYSGCDHAKCERCKRIFHEEPKRTPCSMKLPTKAKEDEFKRQTIQAEFLNKATNKAFATLAYRGRGTIAAVRGKTKMGRTRPVEAEPVILTLSSDDESDEERSNQSTKISPETSISIIKTPLPCEPFIRDEDDQRYPHTNRENVADITNCADKLHTSITCRVIRIGTHRYEPTEEVLFTTKGLRIIAPNCVNPNDNVILNIQTNEIVKIIAHFPKSLTVLFIYTLPRCGQYIRDSLEMKPKNISTETPYYNPTDRCEPYKRIVLQVDNMSEQSKSVIKSIFATQVLEEISLNDANELLLRSCSKDKIIKNDGSTDIIKTESENIRQILIYPPGKGGISINTEDYMCLAIDQYLNDVIIDFYLKYLHLNVLSEEQRQKTHIFSSFFYKRLTTMTARQRQTEKDVKLTASQKRHSRVKNWTKNVNIFEKDFIIIPIVEQSHWFLAIICFPKMKGPVAYDTLEPVVSEPISKKKKTHTDRKVSLQIGNTTITPLSKRELESVCVGDDGESERDEAEGDESDLMSEDSDSDVNTSPGTCTGGYQPIKQPCILIFDSLSGASRNRVVATLRDYLTCEYKLKVKDDATIFSKLNMPGHCVKVPQQNNFTDCGLYLLQYVEQFFQDPIRDYHMPIKQLVNWFETIVVTRKREEISNLLRDLVEQLNPDKLPLPEITFPTINGKLVEQDDSFNDEQAEFEEEEMDEEMEEEEEEDCGVETEGEGSPEKMQNGNGERREILKRSLDDIGRVHDPTIRKAARLDHTT